MKAVLFALCFLFGLTPALATDYTPTPGFPGVVFFNSYTGSGIPENPQGGWNTVDLKPLGVPADAKAVALGAIMIITHGGPYATANMTVMFRRPSDTTVSCDNDYIWQVMTAYPPSGDRSTAFANVPLENGTFQICSRRTLNGSFYGSIGDGLAFGLNVRMHGFFR